MLAAACGDDELTCAEVYTEACRSAFDGGCVRFSLWHIEDEIQCIEILSERPRPGDVTDEFGSGMYGCRWYDPAVLDLAECYRLTAHQTCDTDEEISAFDRAFDRDCLAGFMPHDPY